MAEPSDVGRRTTAVVVICHFVASFAALGLPPFFPDLLPGLGDPTARWAGVLYVVPTVCVALSAPLWGRVADRFGRKRLLVRAQLGLALSFWLASQARTLTEFTAALVLQGLLGGTFSASHAYLAGGLRGPGLASALTSMQMSARAALVAAPITVALLVGAAGPQELYGRLAVLPLLAAVLVAWLPEPTRTAPTPEATVAAADDIPPVTALFTLEAAFVFVTVVSFPYFLPLAEVRGVDGPLVGVLFALPHLLCLLAARPLLRLVRSRPDRGIAAGFLGVFAGLLLHAVPGGPPVLVLARLLLGVGLTAGLVALNVLIARAAAGRSPGALFGTLEMFSKGGAVLAGVAASLLVPRLGPVAPCLLGAVIALGALLALAPRHTRLSRTLDSRSTA